MMAEHTKNDPTEAPIQPSRNPYEDADPIPVRPGASHRTGTHGHSNRTRSKTARHTREDAGQQGRPSHLSDERTRGRAVRESSAQTSARRAQRPTDAQRSLRQQGTRVAESRRSAASARSARQQGDQNLSSAVTTGGNRRVYHQGGRAYTMRTRRKMGFGIMAAIIIAAIGILGALLWWLNRPVPVTVDGEAVQVRIGSSLDEVAHVVKLSVTPGDYVSVTGNVITEGKGHQYTATVGGTTLSPKDAEAYRVEGDETIDFSDGTNITEKYTAESEVIMPYLRMEGGGYVLQYIKQWGYAGELEHRTGKETGEKADVVTKEAQDCVIMCMDPYIDDDRKLVALTFDDGPSDYTDQYLEILERYGVKATFFNLGENAQNYPEVAKRVVEAGHQLCNHTMAHNQLTAVDDRTVYDEITRSAEALEEATGVLTTHIRPPYGDFTERSWLGSGGSITASIRWSGDSQDWALPGPDAIVSNATLGLHSGTIILMHDGGGDRSQDVTALPMLIEQLQEEGYEFVTISDLMRALGDIPEDICSGTGTMPKDAVWPDEISPDDIAAAESTAATTDEATTS